MVQGSIDLGESESIVFSLDDRTGNVLTTAALFMASAAIVYLARGAFFVLLLSLLLAYLLDPAVTFVQRHSRLGPEPSRLGHCPGVLDRDTCCLAALGTSSASALPRREKI